MHLSFDALSMGVKLVQVISRELANLREFGQGLFCQWLVRRWRRRRRGGKGGGSGASYRSVSWATGDWFPRRHGGTMALKWWFGGADARAGSVHGIRAAESYLRVATECPRQGVTQTKSWICAQNSLRLGPRPWLRDGPPGMSELRQR